MEQKSVTSRQNPLIQQVRKLRANRAYRYETRLYCADGVKLLAEAVKWNAEIEAVLLTQDAALPPLPHSLPVTTVSKELMAYASGMLSPQGALFVCRMPGTEEAPKLRPGTLILDGIQDPGNLGTMLRTADALDVPLVLTDGCADPYNEKTVRASMGAIFRTPPGFLPREALIAQCRQARLPLAVTALSEQAVDLRTVHLADYVVVIGSEGQGVCQELLQNADAQLVIPMHPRCESLNAAVAAAIVMWQMK